MDSRSVNRNKYSAETGRDEKKINGMHNSLMLAEFTEKNAIENGILTMHSLEAYT